MKKRLYSIILLVSFCLVSCESISQIGEEFVTATPTTEQSPEVPITATLVTTETMTPSPEPTETQIPPTITLQVLESTQEEPGQENHTDEPQDDPFWLFEVQSGSPAITQSWLHGCEWFGVAGQVFDLDGNTMDKIIIETGGLMDNKTFFGLSLTGKDLDYGPGGYEIQLPGEPMESTATVWVQLKDSSGGELSPKVFIDTYENCKQNLILLNFIANDVIPDTVLLLPILKP